MDIERKKESRKNANKKYYEKSRNIDLEIDEIVFIYAKNIKSKMLLTEEDFNKLKYINLYLLKNKIERKNYYNIVFNKLSRLEFIFSDGKILQPKINWFLKGDNYAKLYNGEYDSYLKKEEIIEQTAADPNFRRYLDTLE